MTRHLQIGLLTLALGAGCGSDDAAGSGNARFTVYGEEFVERGIPAETFEDGWSVEFSQFSIVIGEVYVRDSTAGEAVRLSGTQLFDLTSPGPHELGKLTDLEAKSYDEVGYSVPAIDSATRLHSSATPEDREQMAAGKYSVRVAGTATNGTTTKTFDWGFAKQTRYDRCVAQKDGKETPGIVVTNGGTDNIELTIHGDHFFYDDLASPNAVARFNPIAAADSDSNGEVTLDEIAAVKLVAIQEGSYGTGSASDVNDLRAFVTALVATLGHYRGEGHCEETSN